MNYIIFHEDFSKRAGTERVLVNLVKFLLKKPDNKITLLLASAPKDLVFDIDTFGIDIVFLGNSNKPEGKLGLGRYYVSLLSKLVKFLRNFKNNEQTVLISANALLASLAYYSGHKISNFQIVSCEHFSFHVAGFFSRTLRALFYSKVSVVTLTNSDRDIITKKYHPKKCVAIPNAIPFDLSKYHGADSKTVLAIGRYTFQKGFDNLIKAFSKIATEFPSWKLKIVGDDYGDGTLLKSLIKNYNLKNVSLEPSTPEVLNLYDTSSFYVMSSRFEGLPMVLLEAMGRGLPLVSFDCPTGPKEVIDKSNGILVKDQDVDSLAEAMRTLIFNKELRMRLAKGSENRALFFTSERIEVLWESFFEKIWQ